MASYIEVIREKNRMCKMIDNCSVCPLGGIDCEYPSDGQAIFVEEQVMRWAAEYPIKTNYQKLEEILKETFDISLEEHTTDCFICQFTKNCKFKKFWDEEYKGK